MMCFENSKTTNVKEHDVRRLLENGETARAVALALELYGCELYGFIVNCLNTIPDADDVFGSLCVGICAGIERFNWHASLRTWLYTLARHSLSRHLSGVRTRRKRFISLAEAPEIDNAAKSVRTATKPYLRTGVKQRAVELRKRLSSTDQLLLLLRVDRNLSWREIATVMSDTELPEEAIDCAEQKMRKRFQRAKQRYREIATKEGLL